MINIVAGLITIVVIASFFMVMSIMKRRKAEVTEKLRVFIALEKQDNLDMHRNLRQRSLAYGSSPTTPVSTSSEDEAPDLTSPLNSLFLYGPSHRHDASAHDTPSSCESAGGTWSSDSHSCVDSSSNSIDASFDGGGSSGSD
jgi:hypothetical protein